MEKEAILHIPLSQFAFAEKEDRDVYKRQTDVLYTPGVYMPVSSTAGFGSSPEKKYVAAKKMCIRDRWMIVRGNVLLANGVDIKNVMVRNCRRKEKTDYPNKIFGYGFMRCV